jgi:hypothetical protein
MLRTSLRQFLKSKSSKEVVDGWMVLIIGCDSLKVLSNALRDVDDLLPQRDLTTQQRKDLDEIAQGCYAVLKNLGEELDKYQELDSDVKGISGKSRRVWKRFKWDQRDIDQLRNRINLNIGAFSMFLGRITRYPFSLFYLGRGTHLAQQYVLRNEGRCGSLE